MCVFVENYSQIVLSSFNILMSKRQKKTKKNKLRCKSNLLSFSRRRLTKTTNIIFEIENILRLKLLSFFKT